MLTGVTDELAINRVTVVDFRSVDVTARVVSETLCVVPWVMFNDMIFERSALENNVDDELRRSVVLEIVFIDSAMLE